MLESEVSVVKYNMIRTLPEKKEDFQTLVVKDKNLRRRVNGWTSQETGKASHAEVFTRGTQEEKNV